MVVGGGGGWGGGEEGGRGGDCAECECVCMCGGEGGDWALGLAPNPIATAVNSREAIKVHLG